AVKISRDLVPDTDTHDLTGAYQMTSTGPVRHQVFELNALDFAIGGGRPALNFAASDSSAVSFRCRMRLYSTSVQQIRATPSVSNSSQSPCGSDTTQTSGTIPHPNEANFHQD